MRRVPLLLAFLAACSGGSSDGGDHDAPGAPVVAAPAGPVATNAATLAVSGTAEANATVRLQLAGSVVAETAASGSGAFSTTVSLPDSDGVVALTAIAVDAAGNASAPSAAIAITVDRTPPAAPTVTAPAEGAVLASATVQVSGTTEAGAAVYVTADIGEEAVTTADAGGAFQATVLVAEGARTVTVGVFDRAGNFTQTARAFTVDTAAPAAPAITSPATGTLTKDATITVSGTAPADSALVRILDGATVATTAVPANGAFSAPVSPGEGEHAYTAVAVDAAGNASLASAVVTVRVDRTPPGAPVVVAPVDGAVLNAGNLDGDGRVVFSGTAEPLAMVALDVDGVLADATAADASGNWTLPLNVPADTHVVVARATDAASNTSLPSTISVTVDAIFPLRPTMTAPAGAVLTNAADLLVEGTAEANVTLRVRFGASVAGTATADANGLFSTTVPLPQADGTVSLTVVAVDSALNVSPPTPAVAVTVDRTAPDAPIVSAPAAGATVALADLVNGKVVFSGTAEAGATVEVEVDGTSVGTAVAASGGAWSVAAATVTIAQDVAHAVSAKATDPAGNASGLSASRAFTLDTIPPAAPGLDAPTQGALLGPAALFAGKVRFSGTADAGATVEVLLDGASTAAGSATASGGGAWSADVTVADGTARSARARARDAAGNVSELSAAVTFTVDTAAPAAPAVTFPQQGATVIATQLVAGEVVFRGTAEDGATVDVQVDGTSRGTGTGPAWSLAVALGSGPHSVRARAADAAGNASGLSDAVAFTVDPTRLATTLPPGATPPVTAWGQSVPVLPTDRSGLGELFPGQANSWVLDSDFSLATGAGLQYSNALVLYTGTPTAPPSHGSLVDDLLTRAFDAFSDGGPQAASEAVFLTPVFGAGDGVVTAAAAGALAVNVPPITGARSGYLNGTSDSRLSRTLPLAPGETYTLSWSHQAELWRSKLLGGDVAPYAPSYRVVLRDAVTGDVVQELFSTSSKVLRETRSVTLGGLAPVVLSFELRSSSGAVPGYAELDDVRLSDANGPVALPNGDFEAGLDGWEPSAGAESQNVQSAARVVGAGASALRVTRTFYAPPAATWGRMTDVFENTGTADVTTTAVYVTLLGGPSPVAAVAQGGRAVIGWDAAAVVRDVGIVFGSGAAYVDARPPPDGDAFVFVTHPLTVPAGGKVALLHFVVQLGDAAGGATAAGVPAKTDTECAAILAGYPALEAYRVDLEPGVRAIVANF